jgi:hypothetical protein
MHEPASARSRKVALQPGIHRHHRAGQRTRVLGIHFGYTDTPMSNDIVDDKADLADIVRSAYVALIDGEYQVNADSGSAIARQQLSKVTRSSKSGWGETVVL